MPGHSSDVVSQSQFIRAGAGAGKTTRLILTFLEFVKAFYSKNGRYPRVVMTTFTRKATQEVKERLLVSALKAGETEIFEYINKKSYVQISTIHGLLSLFLVQQADRLKFPQEIRVIDDQQYAHSLKKLMNTLLKKKPEFVELLETYSFLQLVDLVDTALDFKSEHPQFDYAHREDLQKVKAAKIQNLIKRLAEILELDDVPKSWEAYFSHLHSLDAQLKAGNEAAFFELVENFPRKPAWSEKKPSIDPVVHDSILELREQLEKLFDSDSYIEKHESLNGLFFRLVDELHSQLIEHKRTTGELTISDLETLSVQILEQFPDAAAEFSASWDYFMIDEYQDTSPLQVRILNLIIQNKPCFVVGDPQQSIYLFRGARSEVFDIKQAEMQKAGAAVSVLDTNYRSEPPLMNFINDFFANFSGQFRPMKTKEEKCQSLSDYEAYYIKTQSQPQAVLQQILLLTQKGVAPQDICVLSRSNGKLVEVAVAAGKCGIPVQLQAAAGFEDKREIQDLILFNRFLNNPHDSENLAGLLRTPWFYSPDEDILQLAQKKKHSLWLALLDSDFELKKLLLQNLQDYESGGSSYASRKFISESSFVEFSAYYDSTGKREANIFKFLVSLAEAEKLPGFSLGLFLEEKFLSLQGDLQSSNSEAQPVVQPNCVSLMTVHASKGLQFKHVIVIGFGDQPQVSEAKKLMLDEVSHKFSLAIYDVEASSHQVSDWSLAVRDRLNEREHAEFERVLYVALTRAIESLTLVCEIRRTPGKKSWSARMNWLELGEHQKNGYRVLSKECNEPATLGSIKETEIQKARTRFSTAEASTETQLSVTEILDSKSAASKEVNFETALINLKKAQRGTDLHRLFESMKFVDTNVLLSSLSESDKQVVSYLFQQKELNFSDLLQHGHSEWGFGLKTQSSFIQGQIDLWCELDNEVHVLDYKTGSSAFAEKAFEQLSIYTFALARMKAISQNKKIIHSVVYPLEQFICKREFTDFNQFQLKSDEKIAEMFK